jgi:hypothetical protein
VSEQPSATIPEYPPKAVSVIVEVLPDDAPAVKPLIAGTATENTEGVTVTVAVPVFFL